MSFWSWSTTPNSNSTVGSVNIAENCAAGNVNDAIRQVMALVRSSFSSALQGFLAGTSALPIANGGTGATSAAGALGSLGGLSSAYQDLPITTQTGAFSFVATMRGGAVNYIGAAASATIQPDASQPFGTSNVAAIVIRNNGTGALTVARGAGVSLKKNGGTTSADATIAVGGTATLIRWAADDWTIAGTGVS